MFGQPIANGGIQFKPVQKIGSVIGANIFPDALGTLFRGPLLFLCPAARRDENECGVCWIDMAGVLGSFVVVFVGFGGDVLPLRADFPRCHTSGNVFGAFEAFRNAIPSRRSDGFVRREVEFDRAIGPGEA
ncbi:MAG TPA: hypothetical protein VFW28_10565 [Micropepsaceae bacterium]|nr:hypothetical protein [Micropepsaceae bacterium]